MRDTLSVGFNLSLPLIKAEESIHHGEKIRFVSGFASLEKEDQQKETIIQKGIDYQPFLEAGYINWDHGDIRQHSPAYLIGEPTTAEIREYEGIPGFYIEGFLYNDKPMANAAWEHLQATNKSLSKRHMGWSVQGHTLAADSGKILRSVVRDVALTHKPVLRDTTVTFQEIYKSMTVARDDTLRLGRDIMGLLKADSAIVDSNILAPVRTEDLYGAKNAGKRHPMKGRQLRAVLEAIYGPNRVCKSNHYDEGGHFVDGAKGAFDHMVTCLGWPTEDAEPIIRVLRDAFRD
jgi:hypothetical protein